MGFDGKAVLFVEGQFGTRSRIDDPLKTIWLSHLVSALGLRRIERIVPINKKNLVLMDSKINISGVGNVALDKRIAKELEIDSFDVAIVAWDLHPTWSQEPELCLRDEVLRLYRGISESDTLPNIWKKTARNRLHLLMNRQPGARLRKQTLRSGTVLTLCMEPTFESLLLSSENVIRTILEVKEGGKIGWPNWSSFTGKPEDLLQKSIQCAGKITPKPAALKLIRGDMITAKNEWGEYFLRAILGDEVALKKLRQNSISKQFARIFS